MARSQDANILPCAVDECWGEAQGVIWEWVEKACGPSDPAEVNVAVSFEHPAQPSTQISVTRVGASASSLGKKRLSASGSKGICELLNSPIDAVIDASWLIASVVIQVLVNIEDQVSVATIEVDEW